MSELADVEVDESTLDEPEPERDDLDAFAPVDDASVSLFEGDEGGLDFAQRRTLVALLKQRFISARTHPRDWPVLLEHERIMRGRLNDLFLDLAIDRDREVAWKRQASPESGGRFPTLLHDTAWTREETLVLVHLRDRLRAGLASGDTRVFVDREDLLDHIASFRPGHATDESGDEKRARNAVASVMKAGLLIPTTGEERFEISGAVEPLLPLELLQELLAALQAANGGDVAAGETVGDDRTTLGEPDLFDESPEEAP
ncbi:DUF4194 domain-containing protein [Nocardioides sp. Kera G14]|uniref:DUF4194 domain-containing protein n=1 Tax=Nocardioides sp. Kera G14 TaxID=2884264 RepID=UPI001D109E67|nr:DUF4194 domain-containing protein [Nocardioides sp. Kera G14]UDY23664.1 DUF4194 domain-containing protein [Nocardioides sp. Kera G14]